jgi:proteasome beta subunit
MFLDLGGRRVPFQALRSSSFVGLLSSYAPELLPGGSSQDFPEAGDLVAGALPHATTIVAVVCDGGVVLAGDRRATAGSMISKRDVEKVSRCDEFSAVGFAGVLALGLEFVKLFQVELEHYEKMEGRSLSLEAKANRLAAMIRGNLGAAMQGLVVVPLLAGYDLDSGAGRIFGYDPAGGPSEERRFHSIGSGSVFARGALKKLYTDDMPADEAVLCCVQALYDAADDDSATWITPGILEALIPGRIQGHGGTAEVPGGAA